MLSAVQKFCSCSAVHEMADCSLLCFALHVQKRQNSPNPDSLFPLQETWKRELNPKNDNFGNPVTHEQRHPQKEQQGVIFLEEI